MESLAAESGGRVVAGAAGVYPPIFGTVGIYRLLKAGRGNAEVVGAGQKVRDEIRAVATGRDVLGYSGRYVSRHNGCLWNRSIAGIEDRTLDFWAKTAAVEMSRKKRVFTITFR